MKERENQSDRYERGEGPRREGGRCVGEEMHTEKFTHHLGSHDFVLTRTHIFKPNTSARCSPRSQMQEKDIREDNFLSVCVSGCESHVYVWGYKENKHQGQRGWSQSKQ